MVDGRSGLLEIFFPLHEELVLLFGVAGFAAGGEIAFGAVEPYGCGTLLFMCLG